MGCHFLLQGSSQPRDYAMSPAPPALQTGPLPLSHQGNMIQSSSSQLRGEWECHAFCEQGWGVKGWCGEAGVV